MTAHVMITELLRENSRSVCMRTRSDLGTVLDHYSTLVAYTKLKTTMDNNWLARQSFGMLKFRKDHLLFELFSWKKKEKRR